MTELAVLLAPIDRLALWIGRGVLLAWLVLALSLAVLPLWHRIRPRRLRQSALRRLAHDLNAPVTDDVPRFRTWDAIAVDELIRDTGGRP